MKQGLGTQLRHLVELLDSAVEAAYVAEGLSYRPRYTPVMRALVEPKPATIGQIAQVAGITQPAVTQTVALMTADDLLVVRVGEEDGRQRLIQLSERGRALLARLQVCWQATNRAAASLDAALPYPLSQLLAEAIAELEREPFGQRIAAAREALRGSAADSSTAKAAALANRQGPMPARSKRQRVR